MSGMCIHLNYENILKEKQLHQLDPSPEKKNSIY